MGKVQPVYIVDLSLHNFKPETKIDLQKMADEGVVAVAIRSSVGLYTDYRTSDIYNAAKKVGIYPTFYHVSISTVGIVQQMDKFFRHIDGLEYEWGLVLDNEVASGQSNATITNVIWRCFDIMKERSDYDPINYTRQTWWDVHVDAWDGWKQYKLFAARYDSYKYPYLTSPWSDGRYKFKDYKEWFIWQAYADYPPNMQGERYGVDSKSIDLDVFNGTKEELLTYLKGDIVIPPSPLTLEERVEDLERCMDLTNPGCLL